MLTATTDNAEPEVAVQSAPEQPERIEPLQEQPSAQDDTAVKSGAEVIESATEAEAAPAVDAKTFAMNLAASDVDMEMEKRKARAARFGTGGQANADAEITETANADADALKNLERAKRFGIGQTAIGKLDEALPSDRGPRGKKRGAGPVEESSTLDDPGLKKNFSRQGRFANRRGGGPGKPSGVTKPGAGNYGSDRDRAAAEARKKRFAA